MGTGAPGHVGVLEIVMKGEGYGRVCSINGNSADVACRQLGYSILAINMGRKHLWVEWIPCGNEEFAVHRV